MTSNYAPIVLFVYNRPDHTRRTLAALAANSLARESDLIIYADGPKKPEHAASVVQARDVARAASGFRSVTMIERDRNYGLAGSIIEGVSEVVTRHGRVVVVEDDLIVAPDFLSFLNEGLRQYDHDENVMQVSGYAYPAHDAATPDAFFLPMISCWGWATWARAWSRFDPNMTMLTTLDDDPKIRHAFNIGGTYDYYAMACQQRKGAIDSWGVRWQLSLFKWSGLVLYPRTSLVSNAGVDRSGTHGAGEAAFQRDVGSQLIDVARLNWPSAVTTNEVALGQVKRLLQANRPKILYRIIERIRS